MLQGRNISGDKLQYVYTKAPVTMMISDPKPTTHRPVSTKPWPASFGSKAEVFLVEPSVRRTSPRRGFYSAWVRHTIPTTQRPNYSAVLHLSKIAAKPIDPPVVQLPSDDKNGVSFSKVTWKKSTDKTLVKWASKDDMTSTAPPVAEPTMDFTSANFLQFNMSSANGQVSDDNKTVAQLALDLQASTYRLTNDIKSMLLHLGLLAQGSEAQGESNELGTEGSENTNFDIDPNSRTQFKNIQDELTIQDDMRQLLNTFGLSTPKNETNFTNEAHTRLKRDTKEQGSAWHLDLHQLFNQTSAKSSKRIEGRSRPAKSTPLMSGLEKSTIKPLPSFGQQKRRVTDPKRTRAVNSGTSANKIESKDGEPNSKGTASAEQLSGSFGGEPAAEQNTSPKQTNGLYFWVDWNKFFNLTGKPDVRLAYSSRAGDSTKFIPITDWRTKL